MPLYFAYGSNLDVSQMRKRCEYAEVISGGKLQDYRLDFTRYSEMWQGGVADIVPCEGRDVWGLVYKIKDRGLELLDRYEAYPVAYTRFQTEIETQSGLVQDVWVYIIQKKEKFVPPSSKYLGIIKQAAAQYDFPEYYQEILDGIQVQEKRGTSLRN